jgi:ankyrin repeat protein
MYSVAQGGHSDAIRIRLLVQYGASVLTPDNDGFTPLHKAALTGHILPAMKVLAQLGADVNAVDKNKCSIERHDPRNECNI